MGHLFPILCFHMTSMCASEFDVSVVVLIERELMHRHGPLISNEDLRIALGYPSKAAFRQAIVRKLVPVPIFNIEHRRGQFALVADVASWLGTQRQKSLNLHTSSLQPASRRDLSGAECPVEDSEQ